jgi:hypothetical protein
MRELLTGLETTCGFPVAPYLLSDSTVMLLRRARQSRAARFALVPVGLLLLGILVVLGKIIIDFK